MKKLNNIEIIELGIDRRKQLKVNKKDLENIKRIKAALLKLNKHRSLQSFSKILLGLYDGDNPYWLIKDNLNNLDCRLASDLEQIFSDDSLLNLELGQKVIISDLIAQFNLMFHHGNWEDKNTIKYEIAIAGYKASSIIFAEAELLGDWLDTQRFLACAYRDRILGEKVINIEKAIYYYENLFKHFENISEFSYLYKNLEQLGDLYSIDRKNLERAIECYEKALKCLEKRPWNIYYKDIQAIRKKMQNIEKKSIDLILKALDEHHLNAKDLVHHVSLPKEKVDRIVQRLWDEGKINTLTGSIWSSIFPALRKEFGPDAYFILTSVGYCYLHPVIKRIG